MSQSPDAMNVCMILNKPDFGLSETFLQAQAERLPAKVTMVGVHKRIPIMNGRTILSQSAIRRRVRAMSWSLMGRSRSWEATAAYARVFRRYQPDVVLAQYGFMGVAVLDACQTAGVPLVVHFHGHDASRHAVLEKYGQGYVRMFQYARAVVAVSLAMRDRLIALGAPAEKVHLNTYGIDCERFSSATPGSAPPVFLAVGRLVEKKAPQITLLAFAKALRSCPEARLRMIGEGPLLGPCQSIAEALGISDAVDFLGPQPHSVVSDEMRRARAFVQHSIEASDGDCEGTPVGVLEASASGLPVISTRHAGIPDVIIHQETGLLVDEKDMQGMARHMIELVQKPERAAQLGAAGRRRILANYSMDRSIRRLAQILRGEGKPMPAAVDVAELSVV